ncbi:MAG: hypothetical protein RL033_2893, partial [Pseudomonadota bacterium]
MSAVKLPPPKSVSDRRPSSVTLLGTGPWRGIAAEARSRGRATAVTPGASEMPQAAPVAQVPARETGHNPDSPLFRHQALSAYRLGLRLSTPLRVVPLSTSLVLVTVAAALLTVLTIASFGHVDLTARGRGTIRSLAGVQPLVFETDGVVRDVLVQEGELVRDGQVLVRLDSTRLRASLQEAEQQLAAVRDRTQQEDEQARVSYARDTALLRRRGRLTRDRIASQSVSLAAQREQNGRYAGLVEEGLVAEKVLRDAEELSQQEGRTRLMLQDELARIDQQVNALEQSLRAGITQRAHDVRQVEGRRDAARLLIEQTELHAARAGRIESLLVSPGDVIELGRVVARLVSLARPRRVVAFLPERERAFVHEGAEVRVEFDQLPVGEFGSARARVVRVSTEVASVAELERALGAAAPQGVHFASTL